MNDNFNLNKWEKMDNKLYNPLLNSKREAKKWTISKVVSATMFLKTDSN